MAVSLIKKNSGTVVLKNKFCGIWTTSSAIKGSQKCKVYLYINEEYREKLNIRRSVS